MESIYRSAAGRQQVRDWCEERLDGWDTAHTRSEVATSAGRTHVVTAGPDPDGASPSVVLVPGTNMNTATCLRAVEVLSARRRTVVLDVPGQPGLSAERRPGRARATAYGRWLGEALEAAAPGPSVVVGHSLGGAIALACASPQIAGRVLVSTAGLVRLRVGPAVLAATVPWLVRPTAPRAARLLRQMAAPGSPVPDELADWMSLVGRCCRSSLAPSPLPPAVLADRRAVPCVAAVGNHDVFLPPRRLGPAVRRGLGTDLRVVDGAGHLLLDEDDGPVWIAGFVEEVCAAG